MCFDRQILSAYIDDELESSQKLIIKDHLKVCTKCKKHADSFVSLRNQLKSSKFAVDPFTKEAVWTRLTHATSPDKGLDFWHRGFILSPSLMISLSFVFIAVLGVSIFFALPQNNNLFFNDSNSVSNFDYEKFPLEIPVDNVEKLLAYFDIHDEPLEIFIQLPGSSNFIIQGEPRFLKKNEYLAGR